VLIRWVFLRLDTKMSDWFLEQWISIKFCVKLSQEMKHGVFNMIPNANNKVCDGNSWHPTAQESLHVEIINDDNAHHFLQYQGYYSLLIHSTRPNSLSSLLCGNIEAVMWSCTKHPPYSPDLALNDFQLFLKIKSVLKVWRLQDTEDIKMWWSHWELFNKRSSRNVSNSGSINGLSVQPFKGSTLKVTSLGNL